ncbi:MAG: hypothetical protein V4620_00085 [Bacteroidota bacterium]
MVNLKEVINTFDKIISYENVHTFIFIMIALLLQSCSKEKGADCTGTPSNEYFTLTTEAINQTPYFTNKAFDTISFATNNGDTLIFVKTKTDTSWYEEQGGGSPDCGYNKNNYQSLRNTYTTIKGIGSLEIKHSFKIKGTSGLIEIMFNGINLNVRDFRINSKIGTIFYETINKGNVTYNNAIKIYHNLNDSSIGEGFINKEFGVFSIKDNRTNTEYNCLKRL